MHSVIQDKIQLYGIDWNGPLPQDESDVDAVHIPDIECPLSELHLQQLHRTINPLIDATDYGIELYVSVLQFIHSHANESV